MNIMKLKKKNVALLLVMNLVAVCFTGCGKKQIDYNHGLEENMNLAKGPIAEMLLIPSSYEKEITLEGNAAFKIQLKDNDIQVPQTENMYLVSYIRQEHDSNYHEFVANALFDEGKAVYIEDEEHDYTGKLDENVAFYQKMLDEAVKASDMESIDYWQNMLSYMEEAYSNAIATRPLATDYEGWEFVGTMDEHEAYLFFSGGNSNNSGFDVDSYRYETLIDDRPSEKGSQVMLRETMDDDLNSNVCEMSTDQAVSEGERIFAKLNLGNLVCSGIYNLSWEYSDHAFENLNIEYDGYYIKYQRGIAGEPIYMPSLQTLEEIDDREHASLFIIEVEEDFGICIDDNRILSLSCYSQFEEVGEEEVKNLISFSEAVEALEKGLQDYFTNHPSSYNEIILDNIRLTYYMVWNEEQQQIQAVPAYVFAHLTEDEAGNKLEQYPDRLFVVNAVDGSMVDVVDNGLLLLNSLQQMY